MFVRIAPFLAALLLLVSTPPSFAAHAVATAEGEDGIHYYWNVNQPSKNAAEQKVMKTCSENAKKYKHTGKCKFMGASDGPKYIAFFHTKDGGVGISSNADRQQAIDRAYAQCSKLGECPDTAAKVVFDEGEQQSRPAKTAAAGDNCRPQTQEIRCRSNCVNGDCIVEYENGCKIPVKVSPRFDSFTNQWTYPAPSC